ncbi:hypothetical protein DERF_004807 [Dermatophagoides farinae]|uniref:Uncharacterized protein n=1 Tax=Dermatophagoides farinae TaxID=6954 RepID=A0A922I2Q7_DERFA|nr:hypothetical protein DERF_004807 [Dermatophagoides farinae]
MKSRHRHKHMAVIQRLKNCETKKKCKTFEFLSAVYLCLCLIEKRDILQCASNSFVDFHLEPCFVEDNDEKN